MLSFFSARSTSYGYKMVLISAVVKVDLTAGSSQVLEAGWARSG